MSVGTPHAACPLPHSWWPLLPPHSAGGDSPSGRLAWPSPALNLLGCLKTGFGSSSLIAGEHQGLYKLACVSGREPTSKGADQHASA